MRGPAPRTQGLLLALLTVLIGASPLSASAGTPSDAVVAAVRTRLGGTARVTVDRAGGGWAFGTAVLPAPAVEGAHPHGWLFLSRGGPGGWTVALEGEPAFRTGAKTAAILSTGERVILSGAATPSSQEAARDATKNPSLRLPFALGQSWSWGGGPHGWSGSAGEPRSSVDLSGGDEHVLAAHGGMAYTMCRGWIRIVHGDGFATDYYHLVHSIDVNGVPVGEGAYLGDTGTDVTCGGAAYGRHVHFALRKDDAYTAIDGYAIGKWVVRAGPAQYDGSALHGSTRVDVGGRLLNYGPLAADEGIVDADGSLAVNRRDGPGTDHAVVGSAPDGDTVTIACTQTATPQTGRWTTTDLWDRLTDGAWIAAAYVWGGAAGACDDRYPAG